MALAAHADGRLNMPMLQGVQSFLMRHSGDDQVIVLVDYPRRFLML